MKDQETWCNDIPITAQERIDIDAVIEAGCRCGLPLLGYIPNQGPRCRMCNVEALSDTRRKK